MSELLDKKRVTVLAEVIVLNTRGEIGWLFHEEVRRGLFKKQAFLQDISGQPGPVIKVNGKPQNPNSGRTTDGPDNLGMKVWVTLPGKEAQPAEVFAEGKGTMGWVVDKGSYQYQ